MAARFAGTINNLGCGYTVTVGSVLVKGLCRWARVTLANMRVMLLITIKLR